MKTNILPVICLLGAAFSGQASAQSPSGSAEARYLTFQVQTGNFGYAGPHPRPGRHSLNKEQLDEFVHSVASAIGMKGDARHKLAFAVGPLCFDMPDEETRQFIHDAFAVARENDVAVALHIDDSMGWGGRKDLVSNPDNIETADWKQIPNTGRRVDWGLKPMKFAPQMCFNAPAIVAAVKERGTLIGTEVKKEMDVLKSAGKEHLFAGLIAGWETHIGRDFETDRPLGFRALSHRGFSESNRPKDAEHERVLVVKEFIERWTNALAAPGVPREKIYCHIAFTAQGLDHKERSETVSSFAPPEVAFGSGYRPGFSTYPSGKAFKEIWGHVAAHGSPAWISAEGTNVAPGTGMSSGITMETYLGRMFNHGAVMVNIFAWGMGGEAMRNHFFRRAAEGPEPLAAYGKFLRGEVLNESDPSGFSVELLEAKVHRIQAGLPAWIQKTGRQSEAMPLMKQMQSLMKERKWQELDKVADEFLSLISSATKSNSSTASTAGAPDEEARKHYLHELGGPFFVSRDKVQEELKLSDDQKHKLRETMTGYVQETMRVQKLYGAERKQAMNSLRQKSYKQLEVFLKEILTPEQLKRFAELKLQYDMPMIMLRPDIVKELNITDEQRQQFIRLIQEMQKVVGPLIQESRSGGNPQEILAKVTKLRLDCQGKIEALLSDAQRTQWKGMTGTPLVIW